MLVTDAMANVGTTQTSFLLQGKKIIVRDGRCVDEQGTLSGKVFTDVVVRREAPKSALALATLYLGQSDAGNPRYATQIFATSDEGATWTPFGAPLVDDAVAFTLEVAASDPHRVYVSTVRGNGADSRAVLFVSKDDAATWSELGIPIEMDAERAPYIAAVDPSSADRVYIRTDTDIGSRLLVTDDGGLTYKVAFKGFGKMLGFALSPEGKNIFLGGPDDGLWAANKDDLTFTKRSDVHVQCLATSGTTLFACSDPNSGFAVGTSEDLGATFTPRLRLDQIRGPLECAAGSSVSVCVDQWPLLRDSLSTKDARSPSK